jgi:hypothetical protein
LSSPVFFEASAESLTLLQWNESKHAQNNQTEAGDYIGFMLSQKECPREADGGLIWFSVFHGRSVQSLTTAWMRGARPNK